MQRRASSNEAIKVSPVDAEGLPLAVKQLKCAPSVLKICQPTVGGIMGVKALKAIMW